MGISGNTNCHCKTDTNLFAPLRGKMKVLKKIKRRMGLVPRSSSGNIGTNNLPPLVFHQVHGDNIRISRDGTYAKRCESFCKGITFSSRAIKINEKVCIKLVETSNNWSGVIRFGFTANDPATLRYGLPKYACPDLTNKPGYWAKALAERFCERDTVLFYYVNSSGDVYFGINGEEQGFFFGGIDTRGPLWALIDVYGNSTAIEFIDVRHQLNNSRRSYDASPDEVERIIAPMQSLRVQEERFDPAIPNLVNQPHGMVFQQVPFHRTRGRNVRFSPDRCIASRYDSEFCQGYVFTARPLQLGERLVVQILATEPIYVGALALGLTSCDPATLSASDLPDDSDLLLDRPEYWVVSKDVASSPQRGDELSFCVTVTGEVQISKNGGPPSVVMHVDQTLKLWAFLDIYGSTQKIRVLSCPPPKPSVKPVQDKPRCMSSGSESMNSLNSQSELRRNSASAAQNSRVCCVSPNEVPFQPNVNCGTVLVVNLPTTHANLLNHQASSGNIVVTPTSSQNHSVASVPQTQSIPHRTTDSAAVSANSSTVVTPNTAYLKQQFLPDGASNTTGTMLSTYSNAYIEPISIYNTIKNRSDLASGNYTGTGTGVECTICYENSIDSVLYICGHMCMCYDCAIQQWRGKGGGHCPLCRATIKDVIRIYKS